MAWPGIARWSWDWDPWREMRRIRTEMDRLFGGLGTRTEFPPVNVWTSDNDAVLTAELPAVQSQDLDIAVQGKSVTLRGDRKAETLPPGQCYHRQERPAGSFLRTLQLPFEVDADHVDAHLDRGILRIKLARSQQDKPHRITVKNAG